jgi:predicted aspartyl protease
VALTSRHFPYVPLRLRTSAATPDAAIVLEALVDTGFDGDVVLPAALLPANTPSFVTTWILADGSGLRSPVYEGEAELPGLEGWHSVLISVLGNETIVGRGLTDRFLVILDHGQQLSMEA